MELFAIDNKYFLKFLFYKARFLIKYEVSDFEQYREKE